MSETPTEAPAKRTSRTKKTAATEVAEDLLVLWHPQNANPARGRKCPLTFSQPRLDFEDWSTGSKRIQTQQGSRVTLQPGTNLISPEKVKFLRAHPDYERYAGLGAIVVKEPSETTTEADGPTQIGRLNISDAIDAVQGMGISNLHTLKEWQRQEKRAKVSTAITTRIKELEGGKVS